MFSRKSIIETLNTLSFRTHKELYSFALTYSLEKAAEGNSIGERMNGIKQYLINPATDATIINEVITDTITDKLKELEFENEIELIEKTFQEKYPRLYEAVRQDGFIIENYQLIRDSGLVNEPNFTYNFKFVTECLDQCETLVLNHSFGSAVDRAHTALHGYMKEICKEFDLSINSTNPRIQDYWSKIKSEHPKFNVNNKDFHKPVSQIVSTISKIIENINELRNNKTFTHPNDEILEEEEAKLVINLSRVFLQYIDGKITST